MAMKVYNWLIICIFMVKSFRSSVKKKKIVMNKWFHLIKRD
jgi:hypothetical protein